jgi:VanZ family protein
MRRLWLWGPVVAQMVAIFVASSIPNLTDLPGGISDHTGHFVGYALLGGLVLRALAAGRLAGVTIRTAAAAWALSALYGVSDECHQLFVAGRTAAVDDWAADATGAAAAIVAVGLLGLVLARPAGGKEV